MYYSLNDLENELEKLLICHDPEGKVILNKLMECVTDYFYVNTDELSNQLIEIESITI